MEDIFKNITNKLREVNISPIYFVGSGISRRYINSPDWIGLLKEISDKWDRPFERYVQKHKNEHNECNYEALATELENMYFDKLDDDQIEENKNKYYYFRKRIANIFNTYLSEHESAITINHEIQELKKTTPSAIITTNYDELLEKIFPNYKKYISQNALLSNVVGGIGEIYKIHGCVADPTSIVITEKDYNDFRDKSIYLNAKLITLFLEYPIIFMGYSLNDRNVKSILTTIVKMLPYDKYKELENRMWFLKRTEGEDYVKMERINLDDGLYIELETFYLKDYSKLFKILNDKEIKKLPISFLRFIKGNIQNLVASQEYNPSLLEVNVCDIEKIENFDDENTFVKLALISSSQEKTLLDRNDICKSFIYQSFEGINKNSIIRFKIKSGEKVPIYFAMNSLGYGKAIEFIEGVDDCKNKETLLKRIKGYEEERYYINLGSDIGFNFETARNIDLNVENIDAYIIDYCDNHNIKHLNTAKKHFIKYLLNNRLEEILDLKIILEEYRKEIIVAMTNLDEEYILQNKDKFHVLMLNLDNNNYDNEFRTALCYLDMIWYKECINNAEFEAAVSSE